MSLFLNMSVLLKLFVGLSFIIACLCDYSLTVQYLSNGKLWLLTKKINFIISQNIRKHIFNSEVLDKLLSLQ